jgi:hypothetical protein
MRAPATFSRRCATEEVPGISSTGGQPACAVGQDVSDPRLVKLVGELSV